MASKSQNLESLLLSGLTPLYEPLAAREIRLLVIQPGVFRERLRCVLKTVSLDGELPSFEALSYCWNELRDTVIVDNHTISVPSDLAWFLRRLRRKATPRTVWADSICINQNDNKEKGHQVNMMREIYQSTAEAQVYLCESLGSNLQQQEDEIQDDEYQPYHWYGDERDVHLSSLLAVYGHQPLSYIMMDIVAIGLLTCINDHLCSLEKDTTAVSGCFQLAIHHFSYMVEQPWFSRIWTFQEAVLPKVVSVHFGVCIFSLDMMLSATQKILSLLGTKAPSCCASTWMRLPSLGPSAFGHIEGHLWDLNLHRNSAQKNNQALIHTDVDLVPLLEATRNRRCKEPRDRIYGLLGLVHHWRFTEPITPDYSLSVEELYITATWKAMIETQTTLLLAYNRPRKTLNLPSWVPDWSRTLSVAEKASIPLAKTSKSHPGRQVFELLSHDRLRLSMVFVGSIQETLDLSDFGVEKTTEHPLDCEAIIGAIRTCRGMVGLPTDHESTEEPGTSRDKLFRDRILTDCYFHKTRGYQQWKKNESSGLCEQPTDTFHGGHAQSFFTLADGRFSLANFECSTQDAVFATVGGLSVYLVLRPCRTSQAWSDVEEWELRGPCELWDFNADANKQPLQGDVCSITLV
ncbi:heterokaryon incompatibility protein [Fusarium denticulatum]|uniref:Heterokaryon incompatibility protein n=1 Tax=Fusarium denticulatum TaxID=48507 RepID=A0A8H5XFW7_9HYPO|nr:heterokaryon incompatibility protein [Fusarium denticulatum]